MPSQGASVPPNPFLTDYIKQPLPPADENLRKKGIEGFKSFPMGTIFFLWLESGSPTS